MAVLHNIHAPPLHIAAGSSANVNKCCNICIILIQISENPEQPRQHMRWRALNVAIQMMTFPDSLHNSFERRFRPSLRFFGRLRILLRLHIRVVSGIALAGFILLSCGSALARQVIADDCTETADGTIDTGKADNSSGYGLHARNKGIITSDRPLTVVTGGKGAHAIHAESEGTVMSRSPLTITTGGPLAYGAHAVGKGKITIASGSSITVSDTTENDAIGLNVEGADSNIAATNTSIMGYRGVYASNSGTMTLDSCTVNGQIGVYVTKGGSVSLVKGSVAPLDGSSNASRVQNANSRLIANGTRFSSTNGTSATIGISSEGTGKLTKAAITNTGPGFHLYAKGTLELTDSEITTSGDTALGVYIGQGGGSLTMTGGSIKTTGPNAHAVVGYSSGTHTATITDATLISEQGAGFGVGIISDLGILSGTLDATLVNTSVSGGMALFNALNNGISVLGSTLNLTARNGSRLAGRALTESNSVSNVTLESNTVWNLTAVADGSAESVVSNLTVDHSAIAFAAPAASTFQTLTVGNGNPVGATAQYVANGAVLHMNALLDDGGALPDQQSDRLLIEGTVSGTTQIIVSPVASSSGGQTTGAGIVLVEVANDNDMPDGAFVLSNSPVIAGDYEYVLLDFKDTDSGRRFFSLQSRQRTSGGTRAMAIPAFPAPLLLVLAALVGTAAAMRQCRR